MYNQVKLFLSDFFKLPERAIIAGFVLAIWIGALFLMLPKAGANGTLNLIDALFTATSATCVTGLSVIDTGKALTTFGQIIVLILIQAGGLGIMTISTMFLIAMGKRPSITGVVAVQDTLTLRSEKGFRFILKDVALLTAFIEGIGVIALFFYFFIKAHFPFSKSLYFATFHAISAFCNAGFSLFSDSFIRFQKSLFFNIVISLLIITGGIGFIVLSEIREKRSFSSLSLHSKVVLSTTAILILLGTFLITIMEWRNTMSHLSPPFKVLAGFFQSVTARTAGFNTLPIGSMANETLFLLILLMFIGASPGSCGGGIKTSTFATILLMGFSRLKGYENPHVFRRSISKEVVGKAISIVMISMFIVNIGLMLLLITEAGGVPHPESRGMFLELMFETVSAFGTVGLSTGITPNLTCIGKIILICIMLIGRVGPLAIAMAISRQEIKKYHYAEESIMVG